MFGDSGHAKADSRQKKVFPSSMVKRAPKKIAANEKPRRKRQIGVHSRAMGENVGIQSVKKRRRDSGLCAKEFFAPNIDEESQEHGHCDHRQPCPKKQSISVVL